MLSWWVNIRNSNIAIKDFNQNSGIVALAPDNKKKGDKIISSRKPKGKSIMANAFRLAANTIAHRKDGVLKKHRAA
jgi:hypothetical protein